MCIVYLKYTIHTQVVKGYTKFLRIHKNTCTIFWHHFSEWRLHSLITVVSAENEFYNRAMYMHFLSAYGEGPKDIYIPNPRTTTRAREWRSDQTQTTAPSLGSGWTRPAFCWPSRSCTRCSRPLSPSEHRPQPRQWSAPRSSELLHVASPLEFGALNFDGELMI